MRNDLQVKIYCKICGQRAMNVIPLERDKGFEYYCDEHIKNNTSARDMKAIQMIMNRR